MQITWIFIEIGSFHFNAGKIDIPTNLVMEMEPQFITRLTSASTLISCFQIVVLEGREVLEWPARSPKLSPFVFFIAVYKTNS